LIYLVVTHDTRIRKVDTVSVTAFDRCLHQPLICYSAEPTMLVKTIMSKLISSWMRICLSRLLMMSARRCNESLKVCVFTLSEPPFY
jgi:hypothetical protein